MAAGELSLLMGVVLGSGFETLGWFEESEARSGWKS